MGPLSRQRLPLSCYYPLVFRLILVLTGSIAQFEKFLVHENTFINELSSGCAEGVSGVTTSEDEVVMGAFRMNAAEFGYGIGGPGPVRRDRVSPIEFICIARLILIWRDK
ncbi:hypothetical protein AN958_01343 [Leucoagaricus sp. SymC.cos]|nr:hypothetical protein AN958_01343 [Leucoagaricus sp. SymC.cos]